MDKDGVIIVRLLGGLGNQMFQYALGRHLALIHGRKLKLDVSFYQTASAKVRWAPRVYGLGSFKIQAEIASEEDLRPFEPYLRPDLFSRLRRRASSFGAYYRRAYIHEPVGRQFVFDQRILRASLHDAVYLDGFWQTAKYFEGIESTIRTDFQFKQFPGDTNQKMLAEILSPNSVGVHVRHGDNATKRAAHHGVVPLKYYQKAVAEISRQVGNPHCYIFSDDPVWAKDNLKIDAAVTYVTQNKEDKPQEDLRLMIGCKHHILGNSTFSWWGAWLGQKPGQLVYAPSRHHMKAKTNLADYYPPQWKLIDV